ncbi:hypothetical protein CH362_18945 [Leptospira saintgironsiae]|uniref:Uncharacterized protein n=1 Tax=Leptospira saintgironsiae TaxID=2023183 RepID=A0A2M9Y7D0_9LEPT|nr:hypothetical protein CH362_18945 [Leptospira saintgironsiae]
MSRRLTIGASATLRAASHSRSGYATFASVTSFAEQTRAIANVGTPWSLVAMLLKIIIKRIL